MKFCLDREIKRIVEKTTLKFKEFDEHMKNGLLTLRGLERVKLSNQILYVTVDICHIKLNQTLDRQ
jgi:hypothetical protein